MTINTYLNTTLTCSATISMPVHDNRPRWLPNGTRLINFMIVVASKNQRPFHIFQINQVIWRPPPPPAVTPACGRLLAPLAVGLALGRRRSFHGVAFVAGETHHVVVVEAVADGAAVDGTAGMAARDGCPGGGGGGGGEEVSRARAIHGETARREEIQ